ADFINIFKRQMGFYARNCALGPAAGALEDALEEAAISLSGAEEEDDNSSEKGRGAKRAGSEQRGRSTGRNRKMHHIRAVLNRFVNPGKSKESLERNVLFARDELSLDSIDTDILRLLLRYERYGALESF